MAHWAPRAESVRVGCILFFCQAGREGMLISFLSILRIPTKAIITAYSEHQARKVFGLKRKHSEWDLHVAYRALVGKHHPNLGGNVTAWQKINNAFDVLRRRFDSPTSK